MKIGIELDNEKHEYDLPLYLCINACAGSGKTTTITKFIIESIKNNIYNLNNFFVTTFTYNSAKQLKEKITTELNIDCKKALIGTFHSLSHKIINKIDKKLLNNIHVDESLYILYNLLKNDNMKIFENIKFIVIDEFQDLNEIQFKLIQLIIQTYPSISLICVGDVSQNIYTFRGSTIEYINQFDKYFKNGIIKEMNNNYRNGKYILELANLIGNKNMKQLSNSENQPKLLSFNNLNDEINYVVNEIKKDIHLYKINPNEISIITRNNQLLYFYESKLFENNIKNIIISDEKIRNNIPKDNIILSTIHGSKGLEYEKVYLIGMTDTFFPHHKDNESIIEEQRLCYVAITRCKKDLIISYTNNGKNKLTRFFNDVEHIFVKKNFSSNSNINIEKEIIKKSCAVTNLIKYLDGNDYQYLRNNKIITNPDSDIEIKMIKKGEGFYYPEFVIRENYYSEFGIFIDYLIRRMIGENRKCLSDSKANDILVSIYLDETNWKMYEKYQIFINTIINEISDMEKSKILDYIKMRVTRFGEQIKNKKITIQNMILEILVRIIKKGYVFRKRLDSIKIINKVYLPKIFEDMMKKHYLNYLDYNKKWNEIIYDIWEVSKLHFIFLERKRPLYIDIKINEVLECMNFYESIYKYLYENYIKNERYEFILNPILSDEHINGEGDILLLDKDTNKYIIVDIKTTSNEQFNIEHLLQLMLYTYLLRKQNKIVEQAMILNPLLGREEWIDLSKWNKGEELVNYLIYLEK
jgi:hypothetical protein